MSSRTPHSPTVRVALTAATATGLVALGGLLQPAAAAPAASPAPVQPPVMTQEPAPVAPPAPTVAPAPTAPSGSGAVRVDAGGSGDDGADTGWVALGGTGAVLLLGGATLGLARRRSA